MITIEERARRSFLRTMKREPEGQAWELYLTAFRAGRRSTYRRGRVRHRVYDRVVEIGVRRYPKHASRRVKRPTRTR